MPRRPKQQAEPEEPEAQPSADVLTWDEIRENIGPGGIVSFQVSAEGYSTRTHANRRSWHPRLSANVLKTCETEEDIGDAMQQQGYPDGNYILTARIGTGPKDFWKPGGRTVSLAVTVGEGTLQPLDEAEEEAGTEEGESDVIESGLLKQIRANDLMRQVKMSEVALDDVSSRIQSRQHKDALEIAREILDAQKSRGGSGTAEVVAALVPLAVSLLERLNNRDLGTKAAESVIQMVTANAKTQAEIASSVMKDMLNTQMDMMIQLQRDKLGLDRDDDPIKALIPQAIGAVLPQLAAAGGGRQSPPQPPSPPPAAALSSPGLPPKLQPAQQFIRAFLHLSQVRPAASVIYEKTLRDGFGMLPETDRQTLLVRLEDPDKAAFAAFAEWVSEHDPQAIEALQQCLQDEQAARWIIQILGMIADEFLEREEDEEESAVHSGQEQ